MRMSKLYKLILLYNILIIINKCNAQALDTLVVSPFQVIGDTANSEIYAYGLTDALANDLSQIPGLVLVERLRLSSVLNELNLSQSGLVNEQNAKPIGELLGANTLIVGTVQKLAQCVRVHVRAVKVKTGEILYGVRAEKEIKQFSDVFKLQDSLSQKILIKIGGKSNYLSERGKVNTSSEEAFKLYSKSFKYFDKGEYDKGLNYIKMASEIDKNFNQAQKVRENAEEAFKELEKEVK